MHKSTRAALIGAIIAGLITLPGLGVGTLWDNSETAYGEVAREILLYRDAIVMHFNGSPWFVQPPLYFWMAAAFVKLFSLSTFSLRLPSALATIAMGALTAHVVARVASYRAALYATIVLSTSLMQAIVGRLAIMDALLDLAVAATILCWYRAVYEQDWRFFYAGWIAAALGFLAKGPVAVVIALLVVGVWFAAQRRSGKCTAPPVRAWIVGMASFALVAAPWFAALVGTSGLHALTVLIGHYTVGRYVGTIENQTGPLWYYVPVLVLGFFPWVAFLPGALAFGWRNVARSSEEAAPQSLLRLALVWSIAPLLFFSFAKTKLPNYIALELPGLALLVGLYFDSVIRRHQRRSLWISAAIVPLTIGMLAFAIAVFSHNNRLTADMQNFSPNLIAVGAAIFIGSIVTIALLCADATAEFAPYALGAASLGGVVILALVALDHAEQFKPIPRLARVISQQRRPADIVAIQGVSGGNALVFYTRPRVQALGQPNAVPGPGESPPQDVICGTTQRVYVVTAAKRPHPDPSYGRNRAQIARANNDVLFLYDGPPCKTERILLSTVP
ncbi:MAG: glycosyltransferase family 39 protein [Candidatus Eremiobacteraeota bacterium]|nr:glycosyltransferase family 39 protein [Candidatus Eremiobacteraeota bacterium]